MEGTSESQLNQIEATMGFSNVGFCVSYYPLLTLGLSQATTLGPSMFRLLHSCKPSNGDPNT